MKKILYAMSYFSLSYLVNMREQSILAALSGGFFHELFGVTCKVLEQRRL